MPVGATSDLSKTQDACSLSLRERARVRGNETPPTKTAGRILQAQLDRLAESRLADISRAKPADSESVRSRKRIGASIVASPSPRPSPPGRGRIVRRAVANRTRRVVRLRRRSIGERTVPVGATSDLSKTQDASSLSLWERARVRGNEAPPTKTAARILQAQLDRLAESKLADISRAKAIEGGTASGRKRIGISRGASPSPRPSPLGRGRVAPRSVANGTLRVVRVRRRSIAERTEFCWKLSCPERPSVVLYFSCDPFSFS